MKKIILFSLVGILCMGGFTLADSLPGFNSVFKKEFIKLVSEEEGISIQQAQEILADDLFEIDNNTDLQGELFEELSIGIEGMEEGDEKKSARTRYEKIKKLKDPQELFGSIFSLFDTIDHYYLYETDVSLEEKKEIIHNIQDEIDIVEDIAVKNKAKLLLGEIDIHDLAFFESIDALFLMLDTYYDDAGIEVYDETFDFLEYKNDIILEVEAELQELTDMTKKNKLLSEFSQIKEIDNEDDFFNALDVLYEKFPEEFLDEDEDERENAVGNSLGNN